MNTFLTTGGAVALVKAIVDFLKYVKANDKNGYVTQLIVWLSGIAVTLLVRASDIAAAFDLGPVTLDHAKTGTVILAGLGLSSVAMLANTTLKAVDNSQSANTPSFLNDAD